MSIIKLICLLAISAFGFLKLSQFVGDEAVAIFNVAGHAIQIPFAGFVFLALVCFTLFYLLLRVLGGLFSSPKRLGQWNQARNQKLSQTKLGDGFLALMRGDWKQAEKLLLAKSKYSEVPFVNYLAAAQAAQEQGKIGKRDEYLGMALETAPKHRLAVKMTQARLNQQIGRSEEALQSLLDIEDLGRKNTQYIAMLAQAYDEVDDTESLEDLLPQAKKMGALSNSVIAEMQAELDIDRFNEAQDKDLVWKNIAKTSQQDPDFVAVYAEYHLEKGRADLAEKLIRTTLKKSWDDSLVNVYGRIQSTNRKKLLRQVDGWLLARPENAELHLAAGRLAVQCKDVARAQQEFEQALKLGGLLEAFEELGLLHESEQDLRKALALYRAGLGSANGLNAHSVLTDESEAKSEPEIETVEKAEEAQEGELLPKDS